MTPEEQRIAIAKVMGFEGCVDEKCDYRKCRHLHSKDGHVYFPERHSVPMYPDYVNDLNAMHEAEDWLETKHTNRCLDYAETLIAVINPDGTVGKFRLLNATAVQRAEAFLKTLYLWKD